MDGGPSSAVIIAKDITESIQLVQYFKDMCSMRNVSKTSFYMLFNQE